MWIFSSRPDRKATMRLHVLPDSSELGAAVARDAAGHPASLRRFLRFLRFLRERLIGHRVIARV